MAAWDIKGKIMASAALLADTSTAAIVAAGSVSEAAPVVIGPPQDMAKIEEDLRVIVGRLATLAADQVRLKSLIEERWLRNLRQFHGQYDPETEAELKEAKKSRAFVKITRKKTNSWKGRLESLIFPTDDRNYGIQPTPVPSLTSASKEVVEKAMALVAQANEQQAQAAAAAQQGDEAAAAQAAAGAAQTATQADEHAQEAQRLAEEIKEAKKRADLMQQVMDDQLVECGYSAEGRDCIFDMVRLGTGILKGPLAAEASRGRWEKQEDGSHVYVREADPKPVFKRVDPWSYFPDMSARNAAESEFEFERHLWTKKDLRRLVKERGFNPDAVRRLLEEKTARQTMTESGMSYLADLRSIDGNTETLKGRFIGWEYHGPLECDEIVTMLHAMGDHEGAAYYKDTSDPLIEMKVICYFCEGELLKIAPEYPLDSQESLYSVVPFEASEASMFGYGIPDIMEDSQAAMNAGWRMAMDNAGLSTGPQIVVDRDSVEPANKVWEITPRKIWYRKKGAAAGTAFEVFDIPNKVTEILAIVEASRRFIDDETALPVQSEGEITDNPNVTATASNIMALGFNVTFRSVVKAWDDGITVPSMRRLYDWNMQHNPREDIKGDMNVDARGTSVLLVREVQSQVLMAIVTNHTTHPVLAAMLKPYEAYKKFLQSMMVPPDEIMATKDEYDQALQNMAQAQEGQQNPQMILAEMQLKRAQLESDTSLQIANLQRETELIKLAEQRNMKLDELTAMLQVKQIDTDSKERMFAGELGWETQNRQRAEAAGREPSGSGGFVSAGSEPRP